MFCSCESKEERFIKTYLEDKLGQKIDKLEIINEDSVLSFVPLGFYEIECTKKLSAGESIDSIYNVMSDYISEASRSHDHAKLGDHIAKDPNKEWRKIVRLHVEFGGEISDDVEVIYDVDGSIMKTGKEYDNELMDWLNKSEELHIQAKYGH